jgi:hypothetical protein
MFTPLAWLAWPHQVALLFVAAYLIGFVAFGLLICTISVSDSGIVLCRVNRARWQDIAAVTRTSFLGLPYLFVFRTRGFRWWAPLYLRHPQQFRASLISRAPSGHPLREYAEGKI